MNIDNVNKASRIIRDYQRLMDVYTILKSEDTNIKIEVTNLVNNMTHSIYRKDDILRNYLLDYISRDIKTLRDSIELL